MEKLVVGFPAKNTREQMLDIFKEPQYPLWIRGTGSTVEQWPIFWTEPHTFKSILMIIQKGLCFIWLSARA